MRSVAEMVKAGQVVNFICYRQGNLWYATECGFKFPVPVSDVGEATFADQDKALYFMRYIRLHRALLKAGSVEAVDLEVV